MMIWLIRLMWKHCSDHFVPDINLTTQTFVNFIFTLWKKEKKRKKKTLGEIKLRVVLN